MTMAEGGAALRRLLAERGDEALLVAGGGSPLDLLLAEQAGLKAGYISGYATSAHRYALPDIGQIAYAELVEMVRATAAVVSFPVIVDADTGYGDVSNMRRTIQGLEAAGAAAIQIEDQLWPKKCGHMDGKLVEPRDVALRKLDAALAARRNPETVIIARTDALGPHGLDEALERCRAFKRVGADVVFIDGQNTDEELRACAQLPGPVMANMSESGKTPLHSAAELAAMGFAIALFPSSTLRVALAAVRDFLGELKRTGDSRGWVSRMATLNETNAALGLDTIRAFEASVLERRANDA
jgi:2-methylisocitrate lyase-like PEP mutase family enzyme